VFPWDDLRKIFSGCQGITKVPSAVEILPEIWTAWVGCTSITDRQADDGRPIAYSEREREFTFANYKVCSVQYCAQQLCTVQRTHTNGPNSSLEWVLSHWAHFTVLRFIFSERELNVHVLSSVCLSVICLSLMFMHPTEAVQIFPQYFCGIRYLAHCEDPLVFPGSIM